MSRRVKNDRIHALAAAWRKYKHQPAPMPEGIEDEYSERWGQRAGFKNGYPRHCYYSALLVEFQVVISLNGQNHKIAYCPGEFGGPLAALLADCAVLHFAPWRLRGDGQLNFEEEDAREFMAYPEVDAWLKGLELAAVETKLIAPRAEVILPDGTSVLRERHRTISDVFESQMIAHIETHRALSQKLTEICDELRAIKGSLEVLHHKMAFHHESTEAIRDRVMEMSHTLDEIYPKPAFSPPGETAPLSERLITTGEAAAQLWDESQHMGEVEAQKTWGGQPVPDTKGGAQ